MSQHQALLIPAKQQPFEVGSRATPTPGKGEILVKVLATALNPVDWKIQKSGGFVEVYPAVIGSDSAGTVEAVGEGVPTFKKGDRVVHQAWFIDNNQSSFQQYATVPAEIAAIVPNNITLDQAASIPLGIGTALIGLYQTDQPPSPFSPTGKFGLSLTPPWEAGGKGKYAGTALVVLGGSSSVGQYAIQFARLSGFSPIIATSSLKHEQFLKSLGATHVVDRSSDPIDAINKLVPGGVKYVYDAISTEETQKTSIGVTAADGNILLTLPQNESLDFGGRNVVRTFGAVYAHRELGSAAYAALTGLLESGELKPNKVEILPNGLTGIIEGLARLSREEVSGVKLVAHPWD